VKIVKDVVERLSMRLLGFGRAVQKRLNSGMRGQSVLSQRPTEFAGTDYQEHNFSEYKRRKYSNPADHYTSIHAFQ